MGKVGKSHNYLLADPERIQEDGLDMSHLLQALIEDDIIKRAIEVFRKAAVQVPVQDIQAFGNALVDGLLVDLDALAVHPFFPDKKVEQFAGAAAQVEDRALRRDEFGDDPVVQPYGFRVHIRCPPHSH